MKRVVIVHGWEGHPDECWFPWLRKELKQRGFQVNVPQMPNPKEPQMSEWVPHLEKVVGEPDIEVCLVGHSLGCITILRYLEGLPEGKLIGKAVMVAGFTDPLGYKELENYFQKPIDWERIKKHCSDFVAINSDNDPYVPLKHADIFKEKLGAKVIIEHGKGHISGSANIKELPSVLETVMDL